MACKLQCVKCKRVLKEKDDHAKVARAEYVVIEKLDGRIIECLGCGHQGPIEDFEPAYSGKDRW